MASRKLPSQEFLRQCFEYDPETGILVWKYRAPVHFASDAAWASHNSRFAGKPAGTQRLRADGKGFYVVISIRGNLYLGHRIVWMLVHGVDPGATDIDHEDGDGLNNKVTNLREATKSQNMGNKKAQILGQLKGVHFHKRQCKWAARICINRKQIHLGTFATQEEAHAAYMAKATELFGEFARAA